METAAMIWAAAFVILLVIELVTMGLTTIWFAGGAAAGFLCSLLGLSITVQVAAFFVVSIVLLIFTRPFALRYINNHHTKTNVDSLIGEDALVTETINNLQEKGTVRLEGKEWTARSEDGMEILKGAVVSVQKIEGVKLIVKIK